MKMAPWMAPYVSMREHVPAPPSGEEGARAASHRTRFVLSVWHNANRALGALRFASHADLFFCEQRTHRTSS